MSAISEIAGECELASGARVKVYTALRAILCARCGKEITAGELFTRQAVARTNLPLSPRCRACVPFRLLPTNEQARQASPLLRALLDAQGPDPSTGNAPQTVEPETEIEEKFLSRLGPALARVRRKRSS